MLLSRPGFHRSAGLIDVRIQVVEHLRDDGAEAANRECEDAPPGPRHRATQQVN